MSIEVLANGVACNLDCDYCYEDAMRKNSPKVTYQPEKLKARLMQITEAWTLFGGEPLLLKLSELEDLLRIGFERHGETSIQTNGSLITPRHVELFEQYNTSIGISMDGPGELNDARWAGTLDGTRKMTARSESAIEMLVKRWVETKNDRLKPNLIVNLHALNVSPDRLPALKAWLTDMSALGVRSCRLHFLDLDYKAEKLVVPPAVMLQASLELWALQDSLTMKFDIFKDMLGLLRDGGDSTCVWHACDPWNTQAVEGVNGDGTTGMCGRGAGNDGLNWQPASGAGVPSVNRASGAVGQRFHERQLSLYVTPQEHGGCSGCRFWLMCLGHCPGSGQAASTDSQGDWRLKTVHCEVLQGLFGEAERRIGQAGLVPLSLAPNREEVERLAYAEWSAGREPYLKTMAMAMIGTVGGFDLYGHGDHSNYGHGDHSNVGQLPGQVTQHGDVPHADKHGDHADQALL